MQLEELSAAFSEINNDLQMQDYLKEICLTIVNKTAARKIIDDIVTVYHIENSVAKVDFLHLILEYTHRVLQDDILNENEKNNIKYLKVLFRIEPGDFYRHVKEGVEKIIMIQLYKIYKDDLVSNTEALLKVDLQEIFDLDFDQMNEYSKSEAAISLRKGADIRDLDVFFTSKEYFKLKREA